MDSNVKPINSYTEQERAQIKINLQNTLAILRLQHESVKLKTEIAELRLRELKAILEHDYIFSNKSDESNGQQENSTDNSEKSKSE